MRSNLKLINITFSLILEFLVFILIVAAVQWFLHYFIEDPEFLGGKMKYSISHRLVMLILGVVEEEVKYRYFLKPEGVKGLSVSISLLLADLVLTIIGFVKVVSIDINSLILYYLILAILAIMIYEAGVKKIRNPKKGYYIYAVISIIISALWHIYFTDLLNFYNLYNLLLMQILYGVVFVKIRLKYGFLSVVIFHFSYDILVAL